MNNMYKISAVELSHINMALQSRLEKIDQLIEIFASDNSDDLLASYREERQEVQSIKDRLVKEFSENVDEINKMNTQTNFTELEQIVINAIAKGDYYDDMPSECIENISDVTGINNKILRGVLSSLYQKNVIILGEYTNGMTAFMLLD